MAGIVIEKGEVVRSGIFAVDAHGKKSCRRMLISIEQNNAGEVGLTSRG
jgi:hypothetical protein